MGREPFYKRWWRSFRHFVIHTAWPVLRWVVVAAVFLAGAWALEQEIVSHRSHGRILYWILAALMLIVIGQWIELHRRSKTANLPVRRDATPGSSATAPPALGDLAHLADGYASQILAFEHCDPDGKVIPVSQRPLLDNLSEMSDPNRSGDDYTTFDGQYGHDLRSIFHKLKDAQLVNTDEQVLFDHPRTAQSRIRLALRLREVASEARSRNPLPSEK